ncbi:nuclear transport factor 2 family protein [Nannocystis pusilla]|uniref:nuclear transport factor 2 family protein n=2 Tax=Nannocystaceae TaxID=224463 RepID=UPI0023EE7C77|nr:nuclear transport factor 2 family protein [Nannocystis pusilla]
MGYVICAQTIGDTELVATNIFVREDGEWKMVHHHAGPVVRRRGGRPPSGPVGGTSGQMPN